MLKRKAFILCTVPLLLLFAQCCYSQDSTADIREDSATVTGAPGNNAADTSIESLYQPILREVPDTFVAKQKADRDFAYANDPSYWGRKKERETPDTGFWLSLYRFLTHPATRIVFYIFLAGVLLYALYRVVLVNKLFIFYSSSKTKKVEEEELTEMTDENIDEKIRQARDAGDYRAAVRYLYLKILLGLHKKGHISYHAQATNNDYMRQMGAHPAHTEFAFLTRVYDYVWYGGLQITEAQFSSVYDNFQNFYRNTGA